MCACVYIREVEMKEEREGEERGREIMVMLLLVADFPGDAPCADSQ